MTNVTILNTLITPERGYKIVALTRNGLNFHQFRGKPFCNKVLENGPSKIEIYLIEFFCQNS